MRGALLLAGHDVRERKDHDGNGEDREIGDHYAAALAHFEDVKNCYQRARLDGQWDALVAEVRQAHQRKVGFMPGFERLVAGQEPSKEPSFLERARNRWLPRGS